jgi:hypothetical protein
MISRRHDARDRISPVTKELARMTSFRPTFSLPRLSKLIHFLFTAEGSETAAASAGQASARSSSAAKVSDRSRAVFLFPKFLRPEDARGLVAQGPGVSGFKPPQG